MLLQHEAADKAAFFVSPGPRKIVMPEWVVALFADIADFSSELQAMLQQGYLRTQFEDFLEAQNGYWASAASEPFTERYEKNRGTSITRTRPGLKAPVQVPIDNAAAQTGPNDGITVSDFNVEQYTFSPFELGDGIDIDLIGTNFAIVDRFEHAVGINVKQGVQSVDVLARDTFTSGYATGASLVSVGHASGTNVTVSVDDVRSLNTVIVQGNVTGSGTLQPVSSSNKLPVTIYPAGSLSGAYTANIVGSSTDGTSTSDYVFVGAGVPGTPLATRANGQSGTVTIDNTAGNAISVGDIIVAGDSPTQFVGASGKLHWSQLNSSDNILTSTMLEDAVGLLRDNAVPYAQNKNGDEEGTYVLHCSSRVMKSLYRDPDFKTANQTLGQSAIYLNGKISQYLGVTILPNTNAPRVPLTGGGYANLAILSGHGALVDTWYEGLEDWASSSMNPAQVDLEQGIAQIMMPAYSDKQGRRAQLSWLTIRDIVAPTDITRTSVVLTGNGSRRARAIALWIYTPN